MNSPIASLIQQPEGKTLELKRDLSSPRPLLKTLVAFGNSAGGRLVVGVTDARASEKQRTRPVKGPVGAQSGPSRGPVRGPVSNTSRQADLGTAALKPLNIRIDSHSAQHDGKPHRPSPDQALRAPPDHLLVRRQAGAA